MTYFKVSPQYFPEKDQKTIKYLCSNSRNAVL